MKYWKRPPFSEALDFVRELSEYDLQDGGICTILQEVHGNTSAIMFSWVFGGIYSKIKFKMEIEE